MPGVHTSMIKTLPKNGIKVEVLFVLESEVGVFVRNLCGSNPNLGVANLHCVVFSVIFIRNAQKLFRRPVLS